MENHTPTTEQLLLENHTLKLRLESLEKNSYNKMLNLLEKTSSIAQIGGWEIDLETMQLTWTKEVYRIHEVSDDFVPQVESAISFYAPQAQPIITQAVKSSIESGESWDLELPLITAKGNKIWVRALGEAVFKDGKVVRVIGTFQNINDRY